MSELTMVSSGSHMGEPSEAMYCQSKQIERKPRPSLPEAPPKEVGKDHAVLTSKTEDRHTLEHGEMYSGNTSHVKMMPAMIKRLHYAS